ncbi:hypothetical protein ACWEQL_31805 [Kitasatospora sp. NPDC004240]
MLGYEDVLHANPAGLATAATAWTAMAQKYEAVQQRLQNEVLSVTGNPGLWQGATATSAHAHVSATRQQAVDAQTEARALASILTDAHSDFETAQKKLKATVEDAAKDGMKVSAIGVVSFDPYTLDPAARNSYRPGGEGEEARVQAWAQKIKVYLEEATAADQRAALGLRRAAKVGDTANTFNGQALAGGDAADGARAAELAKKLKDLGELSPAELAELNNLMKANSGNPEYGRTLLTSLGPQGTILLADELERLIAERGGTNKNEYSELRTNLANTVAGATRDPSTQFYQDFRKGLQEVGTKNLDAIRPGGAPGGGLGYQTLTGLLRQGNAGYGKEFLVDIGADILAADKEIPGRWARQGSGIPSGADADPVDGILGLMGQNPAAATAFLDPKAPGAEERLKYLLTEREGTVVLPGGYAGLGAAVEAATTGDPVGTVHKGGPHTPEQARVMQGTINAFFDGKEAVEVPESLRVPLAGALTDFVDDTHSVLGATPGWKEETAGADKGHLEADKQPLIHFMRGLSEEPEAFAMLYTAEHHKAAQLLSGLSADPNPTFAGDRHNLAVSVGTALGTLESIEADVILDTRDDRKEWAKETSERISLGSSLSVGYVPVLGDLADTLVNESVSKWHDNADKEAEKTANQTVASRYVLHTDQNAAMVGAWARAHGVGTGDSVAGNIATDLALSRAAGSSAAETILGRNKSSG